MSDPAAPAAPAAPVPAPAPGPEDHLPGWQQWINQFCENWIFAFLVAMAIRLFLIEAYGIPTASMEPMLYGDPGFLKGDHVVVDKLVWRFTGISRWDVTVFQFPLAELESRSGRDARPAIDDRGERLDRPFTRPPMCRNFVKRAVVVPGDVFYIAGGNIYLKQADGTFAAAQKPEHVQEAVWQTIWQHGAQPGYLPWEGSGGCTVADAGGTLHLSLAAGGTCSFTQPLRNLYLKPNPVRVARLPASPNESGDIVQASLVAPQFRARGVEGNIWDLDHWQISRLTSADLDSGSHGTELNPLMDEWVGDLRLVAQVARLEGEAAITLRLGSLRAWILHLRADGWRLEADGKELAAGKESLLGRTLAFAHLDDRVSLRIDGREVAGAMVAPGDAQRNRPGLEITGAGTLDLAGAHLQRDLHYSARGFLCDDAASFKRYSEDVRKVADEEGRDTLARHRDLIRQVREQMRPGVTLTAAQATAPWGFSPETAITAPADGYLLLGDNSPHSWDARMWGWVPARNLRAEALAVLLPPWRWRIVR
jgi:signal peptidase I